MPKVLGRSHTSVGAREADAEQGVPGTVSNNTRTQEVYTYEAQCPIR